MYTYSFHYDVEGDGCTTIGNFLESAGNLHVGSDRWKQLDEIERLCKEQVERERPGVKVLAIDIIGVKEPDGQFYYLPDHELAR